MSDTQPGTLAPIIPRHQPRINPTGRVRQAIDAMVWQGLPRDTAAKDAGLKPKSLYAAFLKPHVKAYYLAQLEVLRTSERARTIHRMVEIRDAADNMPAVNAGKVLLQLEDEPTSGASVGQRPGLVIVIGAGLTAHQPTAPDKPLELQANPSVDDAKRS